MRDKVKTAIVTGLVVVVGLLMAVAIFSDVFAGCYKCDVYITEEVTQNVTSITEGISDEELAKGLSTSFAAGGHHFDFATLRWQGSVVGAWYDSESAVSFGMAKRFEKFDALWHGSYTENGENGAVVGGVTFRF